MHLKTTNYLRCQFHRICHYNILQEALKNQTRWWLQYWEIANGNGLINIPVNIGHFVFVAVTGNVLGASNKQEGINNQKGDLNEFHNFAFMVSVSL
jgi:hypothetical protein